MSMQIQFEDNFMQYDQKAKSLLKKAAEDIALDYRAAARGSAPHNTGMLEKGITDKITTSDSAITIEITASSVNRGYDYAPHMNDGNYKLGIKSQGKAGGLSGIAGKSFPVGKGYLTAPLTENSKAYCEYFAKALRSLSDD